MEARVASSPEIARATAVPAVRPLLFREWPLALAVLVGLALRVQQLPAQVLVADEWHALSIVAREGFRGILSTFGESDHSIPMAAYFELVSRTVGLSDAWIRGPFLLCGLAALLALPLALRRFADRATSDRFAWLLAVSPMLVLFSRFARPYGPSCLLALIAMVAFQRWIAGGGRRWAVAYCACSVAGGYLLLACLPFALMPIAWHGARILLRRRDPTVRRGFGALVLLAAAVLVPLILLFAPALIQDRASLVERFGKRDLDPAMHLSALRILTGTESGWAALGLCVLAALGWREHWKERRPWLGATTAAVVAQWVVTALALPPSPFVFARYALPILPLLLLWAAAGVGVVLRRTRDLRLADSQLLAPAIGVAFLALGPIPSVLRWPDDFFASRLMIELTSSEDLHGRRARVSPFYRDLAGRPAGSVTLIETPFVVPLTANPMHHYQAIHRQHVRAGLVSRAPFWQPPRAESLRSRGVVWVEDLLAGAEDAGDFLVVHKNLSAESTVAPNVRLGNHTLEQLEQRLGPAVHEDRWIRVYALGER